MAIWDNFASLPLISKWFWLAVGLLGALFITKILTKIFITILKKLAAFTVTSKDDELIQKMENPIVYLIGLFAVRLGVSFFNLGTNIAEKIVDTLIIFFIAYIVALIANLFVEIWGTNFAKNTKSKIDDQLISLFDRSLDIVVGAIALLYIFYVWDIEILPLLGSLGIAGLAIAFAFQETLKNLFGGISLIIDKNIKSGDIIVLSNGTSGIILDMSLRSTRIKTWDNKLVIVPNGNLANDIITNISKPDKSRRVEVKFGVEYGTDPEFVKKIVIEEIKKIKNVELKDPAPMVRFTEMADSALLFVALYWVKDLGDYIQALDDGTLKIYERLNREKIGIPFPQRTVWFNDKSKIKSKPYKKRKK